MGDFYVCGVDVGTTNIKVVLLDEDWRVARVERAPTPVVRDRVGPCHDPEAVVSTVEALMARAQRATCDGAPIIAVGISSFGEEGVPVDRGGAPLYPAITWFDRRRSRAERDWWLSHTPEEMRATTGLGVDLGFTLYKWLWLRSEEPDVWTDSHRWLGMADFIASRWTGESAMSISHAGRTQSYNIHSLDWEREWVSAALPRGQRSLPPVVDAGTVVGRTALDALPGVLRAPGTPVVATGVDHFVGCYAAGLVRGAGLMDSLGTSEALVAFDRQEGTPVRLPSDATDLVVGLRRGERFHVAGLDSGADLQRLRGSLDGTGSQAASALDAAAARVPAGTRGLLYLPPRRGDETAGQFLVPQGERPSPAEYYRAALEGWAMAAAATIDSMSIPVTGSEILAAGGGSRSRLALDIRASVFASPIRVVGTPELVGVGAALLAAEAIGLREPGTRWTPPPGELTVVEPSDASVAQYRELRTAFREACVRTFGSEHPYPRAST